MTVVTPRPILQGEPVLSDNAEPNPAEPSPAQPAARSFVEWALTMLQVQQTSDRSGDLLVEVPTVFQDRFDGKSKARIVTSEESIANLIDGGDDVFLTPIDGQLLTWIGWQLDKLPPPLHSIPNRQPTGAGELAQRMLAAYQVDGGRVHLGGCSLEDRPLVRVTSLANESDPNGPGRLTETSVDAELRSVDSQQSDALGLDHLRRRDAAPPRHDPAELQAMIERATRLAQNQFPESKIVATTIIWCKYAEGKMSFVFGDETVEVRFSGWARTLSPPPLVCPHSGQSSHHVVATDDGRITVAEAIGTCELTASRVLQSELSTCSLTGKRVVAARLEHCPVSDMPILSEERVACLCCGVRVSPKVIEQETCDACRNVASVRKADPRMARILDEYPKLDRWRNWKLSETTTHAILIASSLLRQTLVVFDKQAFSPVRIATRSRFSNDWILVENRQWADILGVAQNAQDA